MKNIKFLLALVATVSLSTAQAAILWSPTESTATLADDFNSYPTGPVTAPFPIIGGTLGEAFTGQVVSDSGGFDVVTGTPVNPLAIAASVGEVEVFQFGDGTVVGIGTGAGAEGIGEGAISFRFEDGQSEMGIDVLGVDSNGNMQLQFFDDSGAAVDTVTVPLDADGSFTFTSDAGDFAGVTITNTDPGGVTYDNLRLSSIGEPAAEVPVPTLGTWSLLLLVLAMLWIGRSGLRAHRH